jgi:hypothetical protein
MERRRNMEVYRFDSGDGLEHLIRIIASAEDSFACETVLRFGDKEYREERDYNRCVIESMIGLGILVPAGAELQ